MAKKIFKYPLVIADVQEVEMPEESDILSVQVQNGMPCIWALVDTNNQMIKRTFEIYGTGHPITGEVDGLFRMYVDTFQLLNGSIVYHLFETKP